VSRDDYPEKIGFFRSLLLRIPETWLLKWGPRVSIASVFTMSAWIGVWLVMAVEATVTHRAMPRDLLMAGILAALPLAAISATMFAIASLHAYVHLAASIQQMEDFDRGLSEEIGGQIAAVIQRHMNGEEPEKGPTIQ
jgi:hypothetical protein